MWELPRPSTVLQAAGDHDEQKSCHVIHLFIPLVRQFVFLSACQTVNQVVRQSVSQSVRHPVSQVIRQSDSHTISQLITYTFIFFLINSFTVC